MQPVKYCPKCKSANALNAPVCQNTACGHAFRTQFVPPAPPDQTQMGMAPMLQQSYSNNALLVYNSSANLDELTQRFRDAHRAYSWTFFVGLFCLWPLWIVSYIEYNKMNDVKRRVAAMGIDAEAWARIQRGYAPHRAVSPVSNPASKPLPLYACILIGCLAAFVIVGYVLIINQAERSTNSQQIENGSNANNPQQSKDAPSSIESSREDALSKWRQIRPGMHITQAINIAGTPDQALNDLSGTTFVWRNGTLELHAKIDRNGTITDISAFDVSNPTG